jgi:hypothetical protein
VGRSDKSATIAVSALRLIGFSKVEVLVQGQRRGLRIRDI